MKYGAATDRRYTDELIRLRTEEQLSGTQIAERLGASLPWVVYRLKKLELSARVSIVGSAENLKRARALRAQGKPWKTIAKELGVDKWQSLARAVYVANRSIAP